MENRSMIESNVKRGSMLRFSIGTKLTITFLALAIIPMSAIAYYNLTQNRDEVIKLAKENLIELSRSTAYPIEQLITENQRTSATLAGDPLVAKFLAASEEERQALTSKVYKTLQNFADTHPDYDSPGLLDVNGIVVAALADILVGKDRSFRDYFKASIQGKSYISDILVGRATKRPGVFLTNPVISAEGKIVGINIIWLKADTIWNIIDDVMVGKEGIAYLVDQDGVIIAHPNRDLLYHSLGELTSEAVSTISSTIRFGTIKGTKTPVIPKTLGMDQLSDKLSLAQGSGNYRYYSPLDHRYHVVGYTPLKTQPWTVVVDLPEAQFLAPLEEMRTVAWVSVGLVAMITFIISIILVRGIIRPIRRLADVAVAVEHQQPFEPSDIEDLTMGHDEIAYLGRVFSGMVLSLRNELNERKQTEKALRESEERYRMLIENANEAIFIIADGIIKFPNFKTEEMTGYSEKELSEIPFTNIIHPDDREMVLERRRKRLMGEEPPSTYSFRIINRSGEKLWVQINTALITWEGNPVTINFIRDITEQQRLENHLQQAQKMESIGTLAGGIAHDFNNVLHSIIGYTELTLEDLPEGSLVQKNLKEVFKGAMRAKEMVQQILAFSRKADTEKKPIKVQSVVKEAIKLLRTSIPSTIEIRQNIDAECRPVLADSTQIHQVVMNLSTNAYQAMREKGGLLELTLMEEEIGSYDSDLDLDSGTYLKLTVSDTGHGMDSVVKEKIFDPYFTTRGLGEGTGMGLAVVHGIVKSHGGNINVYSKLDEGTTFSVYLPLIETRPVKTKIISAEPAPTGTERIIFVDDEEPIVFMAHQILERLGYQVTPRTSSVEALEAFRAKPDEFDLVITDMTMPNMTGLELASRLREIRPDIPIIICTGFSEMIDRDKAKSMGILGYVMKPITIEEIARTIRQVLDEEKGK